jgi:CheY-like chemotaxis protein
VESSTSSGLPSPNYLPPWHPRDPTTTSDWGSGATLYLITSVFDTGRGLTTAEQRSLFSRFIQASPKTHVRYGGSGLGLFISRRLVEMQGGAIGVASKAGKGSDFAFYIKVREVDASFSQTPTIPTAAAVIGDGLGLMPLPDSSGIWENEGDAVTADASRLKGGIDHVTTPAPESLTILLVEDNLLNQRILSRQLRQLGCVVITANHGLEAIERIVESHFGKPSPDSQFAKASRVQHPGKPHENTNTNGELSVVLLDWEMPIMDGLSCIKRIRAMEREGELKGRVPVIGVTANARAAQLEKAVDAGMVSIHHSCEGNPGLIRKQDDVLAKPFRLPELMVKIGELLDRKDVKTTGMATNGGSVKPYIGEIMDVKGDLRFGKDAMEAISNYETRYN